MAVPLSPRPVHAAEEGGEVRETLTPPARDKEVQMFCCLIVLYLPWIYSEQVVAACVCAGASLVLSWKSQELLIRTANYTSNGK